jgi:FkbM family methyltransferase
MHNRAKEISMIRHLIERASRGISFKRTLPFVYGGAQFYGSPDCALRYWSMSTTAIDKPLLESARATVCPGDVVWDVGANAGLFAFAAAGLAGPTGLVYAIEPDGILQALLRRSARIEQKVAPVTVVGVAVSDRPQLSRFAIAERGRAANHLEGCGLSQAGGVRETQVVSTVSLDWLAGPGELTPPHVLKIDTEGHELQVLLGGQDLLKRCRPRLICEVAAENSEAVSSLLAECGYRLYDADKPFDRRSPLDRAPWNTLAVPVEAARSAA